jgi:hypothetical protein
VNFPGPDRPYHYHGETLVLKNPEKMIPDPAILAWLEGARAVLRPAPFGLSMLTRLSDTRWQFRGRKRSYYIRTDRSANNRLVTRFPDGNREYSDQVAVPAGTPFFRLDMDPQPDLLFQDLSDTLLFLENL